MAPARIVFLGMRCAFAHLVFEALLAAGHSLVGLIIPSQARALAPADADLQLLPPPALPLAPADVVGLAHALGVPAFAVRRLRGAASVREAGSL